MGWNPSDQEKYETLESLVFLKERRDNAVNSRQCADGKKQWGNIDPMNSYAPTVALELVMLTSVINATKGRDVTTMDIPESFISASLPEDKIVHIFFLGKMAEFIVKTDQQLYGQYLVKRPNKSLMLYVQLNKVMYSLLINAFLFYEKMVGDLYANGFKLNPYY